MDENDVALMQRRHAGTIRSTRVSFHEVLGLKEVHDSPRTQFKATPGVT